MAITPEPGPGPSAGPGAAVIIPHYNDVVRLEKCLSALVPQLAPRAAGPAVEIVVVDNGSTQDLSTLVARFPEIRFVTEPTKGAAAARNRGVAETTAPWLFFTDADCVPAADWLATALRLGPDLTGPLGIIGGEVTVFDETPAPRSGAEAFETVFAFAQKDYVERKGFSVTANLLTTRAVFDATGPFDGSQAEDYEWCRRAGARGSTIAYRPDLKVAHPTRSDWPALRKKWRRLTWEGFSSNGTGPAARARWALRALVVLVSPLPHLLRVLRHPALGPGDRLRGAVTLVRLRLARAGWMLRQAMLGASARP